MKFFFKNIEKWSLGYEALTQFFKMMFYIYNRKVVVTGRENIPKAGPVLFAPNHQNALMDPLAVIFAQKRQIAFLTRGDIFKNPLLARVLAYIKLLPVFRMRDGAELLKYNEAIFSKATEVLKCGATLGLFPEAQHNDKRSMLPLKKAVPRIALQVEQESDWRLGLKVIPVGIYYSNYSRSRQVIQVNFGKPINVAKYKEQFENNAGKAYLAFRDELTAKLSPLMIDVQNIVCYDFYMQALDVCDMQLATHLSLNLNKQTNKFKVDKLLVDKLDDLHKSDPIAFDELVKLGEQYSQELDKLHLPDYVFDGSSKSFLAKLVASIVIWATLPVFLVGRFLNYPIFFYPVYFNKKKIKDPQFYSTIKYGMAAVFYLPYFLLLLGLYSILISDFEMRMALWLGTPIVGFVGLIWPKAWAKMRDRARYNALKKKGRLGIAQDLRGAIISGVVN